jgi:hypothetical protein
MLRKRASFFLRISVCIGLLGALIIFFADELAPSVPLTAVFAKVAIGILVFSALAIAAIVLEGTINQWTFKNGGADVQWFWFSKDPPGAEQLRRAHSRNQDK